MQRKFKSSWENRLWLLGVRSHLSKGPREGAGRKENVPQQEGPKHVFEFCVLRAESRAAWCRGDCGAEATTALQKVGGC